MRLLNSDDAKVDEVVAVQGRKASSLSCLAPAKEIGRRRQKQDHRIDRIRPHIFLILSIL
jgi:hypothetical protein